MISLNISILILRPVQDVFAFITVPENNSHWQYGSMESVQVSKGGTTVGTLFSSVGHFMGRRIESTFEVTEFESKRKYCFKTISGPVQLQSCYQFEAVDQGTSMRVSTQLSSGNFFKVADSILAKTARNQFKENLSNVKKLLEAKDVFHQN